MSVSELLMLKEQLRSEVNQIIQENGSMWFDIADEEELVRQQLVDAVHNNNQSEILTIARDYVDVLTTKKAIHAELQTKYKPQLAQIRSINLELKQKMN